jgi:hypothetical protein
LAGITLTTPELGAATATSITLSSGGKFCIGDVTAVNSGLYFNSIADQDYYIGRSATAWGGGQPIIANSYMGWIFKTGQAERMRLTYEGNLNIKGSVNRATTIGEGVLNIFDGTAPAGTLANGCSIYSSGGELYAMNAAGKPAILTGKRVVQLKVIDDATVVTTGDGKIVFVIPLELNGYDLVDADAFVSTVSSSGLPTVQIRNVTDGHDMLSTKISIDANEYTSWSATTAPVIDTGEDDVVTGDRLAVDVDVSGTGAKGLGVVLTFQLP